MIQKGTLQSIGMYKNAIPNYWTYISAQQIDNPPPKKKHLTMVG